MKTYLKTIFEYLYIVIGSIGVAIIVWGMVFNRFQVIEAGVMTGTSS